MIKVGTSGYSYEDWRGIFYSERLPPSRMLEFYARHFEAVELNSPFYRIPEPRMMEAIVKKAGGRVEFAVKANQNLTHRREGTTSALPLFREALRPFEEAGILGCVLAQFPYSFRNVPENREHLLRLRDGFNPIPLVVEFRHRGWIREEVFRLLMEHAIGFCSVDEPKLPNLPPPVVKATSQIGYVRFHGRNQASWWEHKEAWERYDYLYSEEELKEWVPKIKTLAQATEKCFVFFNNHPKGQAIQNAQMMIRLLAEEPPRV